MTNQAVTSSPVNANPGVGVARAGLILGLIFLVLVGALRGESFGHILFGLLKMIGCGALAALPFMRQSRPTRSANIVAGIVMLLSAIYQVTSYSSD
jgi:hypothetical protein